MNTNNMTLNTSITDLFAVLAKSSASACVDSVRVISSDNFSGWQYWFYYFSKTVKRTLDTR
ncbi:hypothetical protein [Alkalimarinus sediminis]|uniref:Uncharacterized protein n=1 Tax=Alkalimarinus sediminis TaxID=1632866 RepID=A0A9E8KQ82_9ALTE|nr:hypothetical protein [Alkalimarinus sediminis]UZW74377.1 hypothetical protein NNL22_15335 [Alkalimarinus sediminis]